MKQTGVFAAAATVICALASLQSSAAENWELVWSDEFNGASLDTNRWSRCARSGDGWGKYMSDRADLVEVRDGALVLWGVANTDLESDSSPLLTGGVDSKGKGLMRVGEKVEMRVKFDDHQQGAWPALWMCGEEPDDQGRRWPWNGEIDIVERLNGDPVVYHTVHTAWTYVDKHTDDPPNGSHASMVNGQWNVFGFEITPSRLIWSVNGKETFSYARTSSDPNQWPFDKPFYFILDMQLGGSWAGDVDVSTLPVKMQIDWIRVSRRLPATSCSMLYSFDFDEVADGALVYQGVNKGVGSAAFTLKTYDNAALGHGGGALGSDHAFFSSSKSSLWLGDGSASLGCGTAKGFTLSFWINPSSSHTLWSDFFGFRVGGVSYRFEYVEQSTAKFNIYGTSGGGTLRDPETGRAASFSGASAGVWQHVAVVSTPNGTNSLGTCALYLDGRKVSDILLEQAGDLQQINVGQWVRNGNGSDRVGESHSPNNTGIDELAVFSYPATTEQVKWLARRKPGQPASGPGRAMPLALLFDEAKDESGDGVHADNSGTGTEVAYKWESGYANFTPTKWTGALKSQWGFHLKGKATFRIDGAHVGAEEDLGASLGSGMALSFWIKVPQRVTLWQNFMSFRIGDSYERLEWDESDPVHFYGFGTAGTSGSMTLKANTWQHVCMTWNPAESRMEFYIDGEKAAGRLPIPNPETDDVLKTLTVGARVLNESGGMRKGNPTENAYLDEIAVFNHSLSPEQIRWLAKNIPCLPPLDATNLVRTVSADGSWFGRRASWTVREWDGAGGGWTNTTRTTIYPALEDTGVSAAIAFADGVTISNDTFVTPKCLVLASSAAAGTAALHSTADSLFEPESLEIGDGLRLTVPLSAVNVVGTLTFGTNAKIVFDVSDFNHVGTVKALSAGAFALPAGETAAGILSHFGISDARCRLSLSADGKTVLVSAKDGLVLFVR